AYISIPKHPALTDLETNLVSAGFVQSSDQVWKKFEDNKLLYEIREMDVAVDDQWLELSGLYVMPLPWTIGKQTEVMIPIAIRSRVIFLD
ncbi:MAG TPA: hypothetical protein DDW83_04380, partial [Peptococcaceae bacterium]|nr:hypothetical protein [Peptococcaceae bacterium]